MRPARSPRPSGNATSSWRVVDLQGWPTRFSESVICALQGIGYDMLVDILQSMPLTHVIQLQLPNPNKNLPTELFWLPAEQAGGAPPPVRLCIAAAVPQQTSADPAEPSSVPVAGPGGIPGEGQAGQSRSSHRPIGWKPSCLTCYCLHLALFLVQKMLPEGCGLCGAGGKPWTPVETRTMQWLAFACQCCESMVWQDGGGLGLDAASLSAAAIALSRQPPFAVAWHDIHIEVRLLDSLRPSSAGGQVLAASLIFGMRLARHEHCGRSTAC